MPISASTHIFRLRVGVGVGNVTDMHDHVGRRDLLERRAEGGDKLGRQVRDEADRVRKYRLVDAGQRYLPHRRVERGEEQILRHHVRSGQMVEKRRFSGVGIPHQRNHRPGRALPPGAVEAARLAHLFQLAAQLRHAVADQPPVGLDLGFAGAAEETEAAALALEVGPAPHQPAGLIIEMGEFDLQPAFRRRRPLAEDFEDQPGAVDHLGIQRGFEVALLDRGKRRIDDHQPCLGLPRGGRDRLDLSLSEQGRGAGLAKAESKLVDHLDADRLGEPGRLLEPCLGAALAVAPLG
jgi:hypothetical protein